MSAAVVTRGFGSFGSVAYVVTHGFGSFADVEDDADPQDIALSGSYETALSLRGDNSPSAALSGYYRASESLHARG